jgi:hypothetical protein
LNRNVVLADNNKNYLGALRVRNDTGSDIAQGAVVKVSGVSGLMKVEPAAATDSDEMLMVAPNKILGTGSVHQNVGVVHGWYHHTMDTSAASIGDPVYLGASGAPSLTISGKQVGRVLSSASAGIALIFPQAFSARPVEATGTITSAQLLALHTTDVALLPAPGAGLMWVVDEIHGFLDHGGTDYTVGLGDDLQFRYTNDAGALVVSTVDDAIIGNSGDIYFRRVGIDVEPVANAAVIATNIAATGAWTLGDGDLKWRILARLVAADPTA